MTVDGLRLPAKGLELLLQVAVVHDLLCRAGGGQPVLVHHADQVIQLVMRSLRCRFPNLALVHFAVAAHHIHVVVVALALLGNRHADAQRQALTQQTRGRIHLGQTMGAGMALKTGIHLAQGLHFLIRQHAIAVQHRVLGRYCMALGQHHPTALRGLQVHIRGVDGSQYINDRQRSAGMSGIGCMNHIHNGTTISICLRLQRRG